MALDVGDYASGMADDTALDVAYTVGNALATAGANAGLSGATGPLITGAAAVGIGVTDYDAGVGPDDAECSGSGDVCEQWGDALAATECDGSWTTEQECNQYAADYPLCASEWGALFSCAAAELSAGNCDVSGTACPSEYGDVADCAAETYALYLP